MEMGRSISNLSRWLKLRLAVCASVFHTLAVAAGTLLVAHILLLRISSQRLADETHSLNQSVKMANQLEVALGSRTQSHIVPCWSVRSRSQLRNWQLRDASLGCLCEQHSHQLVSDGPQRITRPQDCLSRLDGLLMVGPP